MLKRICKLLRISYPDTTNTGLLWASGKTVPVDATAGYQTGCIFQHTDGTTGTSFYVNDGSVTSCDFNAMTTSAAETLAGLSDVGALAYTSGKVIVADGDSYEEVAISGDATLSSAGVVAITMGTSVPTPGTVVASKVVVVSADKDISAFRTVGCVNLDCGSATGAGVGGTLDIYSATTAKGRMNLAYVDAAANNSLLITNDTISGSDKTATFTNTTGKVVLSTDALTCAEVDVLDAVTPGTAYANKAVVLGGSKEIATITTATITTGNIATVNATNIDAGADAVKGTIDIFPTTTARGKLILTAADNGDASTSTITNAAATGGSVTCTIPALTGYAALSTAALSLAEVDVLQDVTAGTNAANKALVVDATKALDYLLIDTMSVGIAAPSLSVGTPAAKLIDTVAGDDNAAFYVGVTTATNKTSANTSCIAAYLQCASTAAATNTRLQCLLSSTSVGGNIFDAYAVQGHTTIAAAGTSTQNANAHLTGVSGKCVLTGAVGQGWVTGVLAIVEGAGAVTGLCHVIAAQVEATCTDSVVDSILYLGADALATNAIEIADVAHVTNLLMLNASSGCLLANDVNPHAAPDGDALHADKILRISVAGTPYYIPLFDTII